MQKRITLERGDNLTSTVFAGRKREMSRSELQGALAPTLTAWIKAICLWNEPIVIGDYRFASFSINVTPEVQVYVQFWSEPGEPVSWEVSSGHFNPPADKWIAGERSERIEAFGFERGGNAENFQAEVEVSTDADARRIAKTVVDIFYAAFDYRGQRPVELNAGYDTRAEARLAYDSFTPEDLQKLLNANGFRSERVNDDEDTPALQAIRRGIVTTVLCVDRVPDQNLFRRAILISDVGLPKGAQKRRRETTLTAPDTDRASAQLRTMLSFEGGVTVDWVVSRLAEWDHETWSQRKGARKRSLIRSKGPSGPIH